MTAHFVIDTATGRIVLMCTVIALALFLHRQGYDVATALLLAAAALGIAGQVARRALPRDTRWSPNPTTTAHAATSAS